MYTCVKLYWKSSRQVAVDGIFHFITEYCKTEDFVLDGAVHLLYWCHVFFLLALGVPLRWKIGCCVFMVYFF